MGSHIKIYSLMLFALILLGCASSQTRIMTVTAYSDDKISCSWERGSWKYLKLDFWNRYVSAGPDKGRKYDGKTASCTIPQEPHPGLFSWNSLKKPWMIPVRIIFFPWLFLQQDGTIAADTQYYPYGTRMLVPGYGWGVVEDKGGAIKGPDRIDLFYNSRKQALKWGRQKIEVKIEK